jgi:hypothetical protein
MEMGLTVVEIEGLAVSFYERLGFDATEPIDTFRLARKRLGPHGILLGTSIVGLPAARFVKDGMTRIAVNKRLSMPYAMFFAGHELGHEICDEIGYREDDLERVCDHLGAALQAPMPAVRKLYRALGNDLKEIADEVGATQTWAALRLAEYLKIPRAVLTPQRIYLRGPDEFVWGPEDELRRIGHARKARPGITKVRLTDDTRRIVIDIDELAS